MVTNATVRANPMTVASNLQDWRFGNLAKSVGELVYQVVVNEMERTDLEGATARKGTAKKCPPPDYFR